MLWWISVKRELLKEIKIYIKLLLNLEKAKLKIKKKLKELLFKKLKLIPVNWILMIKKKLESMVSGIVLRFKETNNNVKHLS